ncbi:hypothetical protein GRI34_00190 [Erythrobacter aquimaris]|uniref:DUF2147 domain-containing protein n=1 Tax=Qipengyuania aquimaris TaxID=255984 RepID=A0A6I4TG12_9SPHN|nr:hypothetical protein [Qipengyuania aquimaris]MXO94834.1 hypothetical protein [Qipengyuania aquimaris]
MRSALATSCFALMLGGCAFSAPADAYTVAEVLEDISSEDSKLDGKVIEIIGWLGQCGGNNCAIFSSLEDARKVAAYDELPDEEWMPAFDRGLGIGGNDAFDDRARLMQFSEVVIRGEINATWKVPPDESGTSFGCFDRCDDIRPHSIKLVL